jgi:hypothetical protein
MADLRNLDDGRTEAPVTVGIGHWLEQVCPNTCQMTGCGRLKYSCVNDQLTTWA